MLHKFVFDGTRIVLDVNSGAVHVVDELTWDILDIIAPEGVQVSAPVTRAAADEALSRLQGHYGREAVMEALDEVAQLEDQGLLFAADLLADHYEPNLDGVVKSLCLNVAHDCNLRCRYCFAGKGDFGGERLLMPAEVGKKAIDFLLSHSGRRRHLEADFFGGEPLMNWEVVKELINYGQKQAVRAGKELKLTLTTNALLLSQEVRDYLRDHHVGVVLSLDGRPAVHDAMRPTVNGKGSYQAVLPHIQELVRDWGHQGYYVRGTYTRHNPDFAADVLHMADLGLHILSVEPVVADPAEDYALREEDVPALAAEYEKLTRAYLAYADAGKPFDFFHFNLDLSQGPCLAKRLSGCGAGYEYLAVTPEGDIYPCHQFVGRTEFRLGNVMDERLEEHLDRRRMEEFRHAHVYNKEACRRCWAKFYCSGGCHANAQAANGTIYEPYRVGCLLQRKRLECAIYIQVKKAGLA